MLTLRPAIAAASISRPYYKTLAILTRITDSRVGLHSKRYLEANSKNLIQMPSTTHGCSSHVYTR